jgi:hypothetical protein
MWKGGSLSSIDIFDSDSEIEDDEEPEHLVKKHPEDQTAEAEVKKPAPPTKERVAGIKGDTVLQIVTLHSKKSANETFMNATSSDLEKVCVYVCVCACEYMYVCMCVCAHTLT